MSYPAAPPLTLDDARAVVQASRILRDCRLRYQIGSRVVGTSDCAIARDAHSDVNEPEALGLVIVRCEPELLIVTPTTFAREIASHVEEPDAGMPLGWLFINYGSVVFDLGPLRDERGHRATTLTERCEPNDAGRRLAAQGRWHPPGNHSRAVWFAWDGARWGVASPISPDAPGRDHSAHPMFHL